MDALTSSPKMYCLYQLHSSNQRMLGAFHQRAKIDCILFIFEFLTSDYYDFQAGPLENVRIPLHKETGKPRGFGFIVYQDECSVKYACELLNSLKLFGRPITCKPQNSNESSKPESLCHSPIHPSYASDDETSNQRKFDDRNRSPLLPTFGCDDSPYGRMPVMASERTPTPTQRVNTGGSILPTPFFGVSPQSRLHFQALMSQTLPNWIDSVQQYGSPGVIRQSREMYERRHSYDSHERRHRQRPY